MALEYDLSKVADSTKALWKDESRSEAERDDAWGKAVSIIHWCMVVEIGEITEENVADWYTRYKMASPHDDLKLEDVYSLVGLTTNVWTTKVSDWLKRQYAYRLADSQRALGVIKSV